MTNAAYNHTILPICDHAYDFSTQVTGRRGGDVTGRVYQAYVRRQWGGGLQSIDQRGWAGGVGTFGACKAKRKIESKGWSEEGTMS